MQFISSQVLQCTEGQVDDRSELSQGYKDAYTVYDAEYKKQRNVLLSEMGISSRQSLFNKEFSDKLKKRLKDKGFERDGMSFEAPKYSVVAIMSKDLSIENQRYSTEKVTISIYKK